MKVANAIIRNIVDTLGLTENQLSVLAELYQRSIEPERTKEEIMAEVIEGDDVEKVLKILRISEDLITEDMNKSLTK